MNVIRRIAKLCGIVGGIWAIVLPLFVLMKRITMEVSQGTLSVSGLLPALFVAFILIALGVLALVSILALKNKLWLRRVLMLVSIAGVIVWGLFSMLISLLLPAVVLLILAAIGMRKKEKVPLTEVT